MNEPKDGTVTVTGCMDCPVYDGESGECQITPDPKHPHSTRYVPYEICERDAGSPDWCPLRTRPVVLTLTSSATRVS